MYTKIVDYLIRNAVLYLYDVWTAYVFNFVTNKSGRLHRVMYATRTLGQFASIKVVSLWYTVQTLTRDRRRKP
jgi:hypothetical protein